MANRDQLRGQWNEVKGRLKENWGQLTDDDLSRAEGSADRLVGVVQQKTGAAKNEIEAFLDSVLSGKFSEHASETASQYADVGASCCGGRGRLRSPAIQSIRFAIGRLWSEVCGGGAHPAGGKFGDCLRCGYCGGSSVFSRA